VLSITFFTNSWGFQATPWKS